MWRLLSTDYYYYYSEFNTEHTYLIAELDHAYAWRPYLRDIFGATDIGDVDADSMSMCCPWQFDRHRHRHADIKPDKDWFQQEVIVCVRYYKVKTKGHISIRNFYCRCRWKVIRKFNSHHSRPQRLSISIHRYDTTLHMYFSAFLCE